MQFVCEGAVCDTSEMRKVSPGISLPMVYLTNDHKAVYVLTLSKPEGLQFHRARGQEIRCLAEQLNVPELLKALAEEA